MVESAGFELLGVELLNEGRRPILWVYIDHSEGVNIRDCARLSPEISAALDTDDPLTGTYELRVSSPGLDRPLMSATHFQRALGQKVKVQLLTALRGRRKFTGTILGVEAARLKIRCSDGEQLIPLEAIRHARLQVEVNIGR